MRVFAFLIVVAVVFTTWLDLATRSRPAAVAAEASVHGRTVDATDKLGLHVRRRTETAPGSGRYHAVESSVEWSARETAIVVCDMWDSHWCRGASARVAEMAPRMNEVLKSARKRGVLVIHCPSDCMKFYEKAAQRKLAASAPPVATKVAIERWCKLDERREGPLPIDDRDGGCDCQPHCQHGAPWKRQIATLEIAPEDAITDNAEAYYLMRQRGIKNVIVMGVHANICVLGRPFSIRQMVYQGQNVVLMRDMTDTMYNSESKPKVSHFSGTDLIVEHIEKYWCPTITSSDLAGGSEFRFAADHRPHIAIVMAEDEYGTARTLTEFASQRLAKDFRVSLIYGNEKNRDDLPGVSAVRAADLLLVSARRRVVPKEQLAVLRNHVAAGKHVVGIRTASHAFSPFAGKAIPAGHDAWNEFDRDVLGGNYTGHYGAGDKDVAHTRVAPLPAAKDHAILRGVPTDGFESHSWLYKVSPLSRTTTPLLLGSIEGQKPEPVAWTNAAGKSRVFYTSLGHADDFKLPAFVQLLENGIRWALAKEHK